MADNNAEVKDITKPVGTVDNTVDPNEIQLVEHVKEKHSKKINDMAKNRPMGEDNVVDMIEKKLSKRSKSELQLLVLIEQEISYRETIGCQGTFILCLMLFAVFGYVSCLFIYSAGFNCSMGMCPGTSFFLIFAILNTLVFIHLLSRWKVMAKARIKYMKSGRHSRTNNNITKIVRLYSRNLGLHGKFYFYKLYGGWLLEKVSQTYNYVYIYTCTLPAWINILFCLLYVVESLFQSKTMFKTLRNRANIIDAKERDMNVLIQVLLDLIYMVVPLIVPYAFHGLPTNINEAILILIMPSISLLGKLHSLFEAVLKNNLDILLVKKEYAESRSVKRHRKSLYGLSIAEKESKRQNKHFIRPIRILILLVGVLHALLFSSIFVAHVTYVEEHDKGCINLYDGGCIAKMPFCYSVYQPTCNCAYLSLESVNLPTIPEKITNEMNALKRIEIVNCNVTKLPNAMENLKLLAIVDLSNNKLTEFNIDMLQWNYITTLNLQFNNISKYNMKALWKHETLINLNLNDNPNFAISNQVDIEMPMLRLLDLRNNSMVLPTNFGKDQFPSLIFLYLSGNDLREVPQNFDALTARLSDLYIARCQLNGIFQYDVSKLNNFDVRDNNISIIDSTILSTLSNNNARIYLSGNPVCTLDPSLKDTSSCEEMCSNYCWYKASEVEEAGYGCDAECNSKSCNHDQGDCSVSLIKKWS